MEMDVTTLPAINLTMGEVVLVVHESWDAIAGKPAAIAEGATKAEALASIGAVADDDERLSDAREPLSHEHDITDVTGLEQALDDADQKITDGDAAVLQRTLRVVDYGDDAKALRPDNALVVYWIGNPNIKPANAKAGDLTFGEL